MNLIQKYFGKHHQGKGQALYTSTSYGLGGTIGSYYSGYFWESLGYESVYLLSAICATIALLIAYLWVGKPVTRVSEA
jgi:PPP family 3-phenylpropionic acid transporter